MLYYYNYMKLTKPMLRAFYYIISGENTLTKVAKALNKSIYWTDAIINSLEEEGFIAKENSYKLKGSRILVTAANTLHAVKLKALLFEYLGISFEDILTESRLLYLAALSEDWMTTDIAVKLSGISKHIIYRYRKGLKDRGVIIKNKNLYKVNGEAWPLLREFLTAYKNYAKVDGQVMWKYNEEIIFKVNREGLIQDNATGLHMYKNFGVNVGVISALCLLPKRKISKEEIFVHSLFEVDDPRTLHLALTFYLKNNLNFKKVMLIAMKYGKYSAFINMMSFLKTKELKIKLENLPSFDRRDFVRIANMYEVKNV